MGNHIYFFVPIPKEKYNPYSTKQHVIYDCSNKRTKNNIFTNEKYYLLEQIVDCNGKVYDTERFVITKEIPLSRFFRLCSLPYDRIYTDFKKFKKLLIKKREIVYDFEEEENKIFLEELENLFKKYPTGFIYTT